MASKSNIRSMRFSDDVVKLIEAQPGDTFTAKFEALIYHCVQELPEKEKSLKLIQDCIVREDQRLDRIRKQVNDLENYISRFASNLQFWNSQTKQAIGNIDRLLDDCNTN